MKKIFVYALIIAIEFLNNPFHAKANSIVPEITAGVVPVRSPLEILVYDYLPYILLPLAVVIVIVVLILKKKNNLKKKK
jgi:hypothetical protein